MIKLNQIYQGDCLEVMKDIDDSSIDLIMTSPPYDNLRTYENNVGIEWNERKWRKVIRSLTRIMKPSGVIVWIVGDASINGSETGTSFKQALYFMEQGFKLHDTMIYQKKGMKFPAEGKYNQVFEYMFIFCRGKIVFNPICDRKNKHIRDYRITTKRERDGSLTERQQYATEEYGKRFNIWKYSTGGAKTYDHPAIFPEGLARDHIISWSSPGHIVYDPFMGSGTTAVAAKKLGRKYIGSEISKKYCEIAKERLAQGVLEYG